MIETFIKNKISIVGYGEIGKSLHELYLDFKQYDVKICDPYLNKDDNIYNSEFLNICIPYNKNFVSIVNNYILKYKPKITVIHSTVAPGTTLLIKGNVCHSPNRGLHPNLKEGIKTFVKYIGSEDFKVSKEYAKHLHCLDIEYYICKNSKTSEYAKLIDTTYYGLCIAFHSDVKKICDKEIIDFEEVMTIYNKSYNDGYKKLNIKNVIRPVLYPTDKIGGHCIIPNAEILSKYTDSSLVKNILKYS
jgi:hypothetical protein